MYIIWKIKLYTTEKHNTIPKAAQSAEQKKFTHTDNGNTKCWRVSIYYKTKNALT